MGIFGKNEDSVAFEDEEIQETVVDDTVDAGDGEVPADAVSSDMPEGDGEVGDDEEIADDDEMVEDDEAVEDEDDDPSCDGCELDTTMNPAADMVDVSSDGNTATADEEDEMTGDDEDFAAEDDDLADTAQDATAPTPFDPKTMPDSNLD